MRIIIVGCGKVGETLASTLCKENHKVVIVDREQKVIDEQTNRYDIIGICGSGTSSSVLKDAGVQNADLLIAVTVSDELNLLVCLIAKKLGVKATIARVRQPELVKEINILKDDLGLSMAINPESTAAREIAQLIRFPSAVEVDSFAKGRVDILKLVVSEKSPFNGLVLKDIFSKSNLKILICAVERGGEMFIPSGEFKILAGDKISVVVPKSEEAKFFRFADILNGRINNAIIVGGGKIAFYLAQQLSDSGIDVKIVEKNRERCEEISEALPKVTVLDGNTDEHTLLIEEGLETVGAFAALTEADEENVMLSVFASTKSNCKLITKINHHALAELCKDMNVGSIITPKLITAEHILRYVRAMQNTVGSDIETLYNLNEFVEALEFNIRGESKFTGIELMNLKLKKNLLIACINRKGNIIIPGGHDTIEPGDTVIVVTTHKGFNEINDIFAN